LPAPFLSIVIPAHNEEHRLPVTLQHLFAFLGVQDYKSEILVVENGSQDRTLQIAQEFAAEFSPPEKERVPRVRVFHEVQSGKGRAVRRGMLAALGEYRFMCDADFSMPIAEINRFFPPAVEGADIVIASREALGSVRYDEPAYRHFIGRAYNTLIRVLALPGLHDTQCGFKCFRGEVAEDLFHRQTLTGWSFDVEVLYIARQLGYKIVELPIPWYFNPDSKVHVVKDSFHMAFDLLSIRLRGMRGFYDGKV
jgi:dolichyl-phosphate beta-glucosyltransferase